MSVWSLWIPKMLDVVSGPEEGSEHPKIVGTSLDSSTYTYFLHIVAHDICWSMSLRCFESSWCKMFLFCLNGLQVSILKKMTLSHSSPNKIIRRVKHKSTWMDYSRKFDIMLKLLWVKNSSVSIELDFCDSCHQTRRDSSETYEATTIFSFWDAWYHRISYDK